MLKLNKTNLPSFHKNKLTTIDDEVPNYFHKFVTQPISYKDYDIGLNKVVGTKHGDYTSWDKNYLESKGYYYDYSHNSSTIF